jgi:hypothetical protein
MPSIEEQNKGKKALVDKAGVDMMWAKYDEPDILGLLNTYQVHEPMTFALSDEAKEYIEVELKKLKTQIENETDKTKLKELKKDLSFKLKAVSVFAIMPAEFYKENFKDMCWTILAQSFDFNQFPDALNLAKDQIVYATLLQNPLWESADPDSEVGAIRAYVNMLAENHPQKNEAGFVLKTLEEIELGK